MKHSVRFYLKTKHGADRSSPAHIRLRVFWATQRVEMHTGLQVSPDYWVQQERQLGRCFGSVLDNTDADIFDCIDIFTDTMSH